jgi:hypothetical protein
LSKNACKNTGSPRAFFLLRGWQIRLGKQSSQGVLGADGWLGAVEGFDGPGDVEGGVVPEDGAFAGGVVEIGGLVEYLGGVREDEEAVGEAFGNPEELKIVFGGLGFEMKSGPFPEVGGVAAEVDGDVPDMAGEDADEFPLGLAELVVEPAEDALDGERLIVLNESGGKAGCGKGRLIEYFCEPAATIPEALGLNEFDVIQGCFQNLHPASLAVPKGTVLMSSKVGRINGEFIRRFFSVGTWTSRMMMLVRCATFFQVSAEVVGKRD